MSVSRNVEVMSALSSGSASTAITSSAVTTNGGPAGAGAQRPGPMCVHVLEEPVAEHLQQERLVGADFYTRRNSPEEQQKYLDGERESSTPAARSPSPSARRRPPYRPALNRKPDTQHRSRRPGTPAIARRTTSPSSQARTPARTISWVDLPRLSALLGVTTVPRHSGFLSNPHQASSPYR